MRTFFSVLLLALTAGAAPSPTPRTFRVDYFHTGNAQEEHFSLDRLVVEPLPFPGNPARPLDDLNLGHFFFEVRDAATQKLLYSRGFSSIYGEWVTTAEAKQQSRTFSESLRFPTPSVPVQVTVKKRDAKNAWGPVWSFRVDPKDMFVDPSTPPSPGPLVELMKNGPSASKVDFLILGDGYTAAERPKFEKDARRLMEILFRTQPFKDRRKDFNVWGLCPPAAEPGISRPSLGIHRRSPLGTTYDTFGSERYILTTDNRAFRDVASFAPYDMVEIITNSQTYGGGGIFNLYSTVAADSLWSPYIFVHELGHHFAALADEYYTSDVPVTSGASPPEPWELNVTREPRREKLKWRALVKADTPVPTPWPKEAFEEESYAMQEKRRKLRADRRPESEMDALLSATKVSETKLLSQGPHAHAVGAFEGGGYARTGAFRPQQDCIMFTRDEVPFCGVCEDAIRRVIDLDTRAP